MDNKEEKKKDLAEYFRTLGGIKPGELNIGIYPSYSSGKSMIIPSLIQRGVLAKADCIFYDCEGSLSQMANRADRPQMPTQKVRKWRKITEDWEISQES